LKISSTLGLMGHGDVFAAAASNGEEISRLELDPALEELFSKVSEQQPRLPFGEDEKMAFARHLGASVPEGTPAVTWLASLFPGDFYLCWAASNGEEAALRALVDDYVRPACRIAAGAPGRVDELLTEVSTHLSVPTENGPPRIASYSGRGPLEAWLRMVAKRRSIELYRGERPRPAQEEYARRALNVMDPELDFLKFRYARQFNAALEEVLAALSTEDANLLYLTSVEQVSSEAVAQMRGVSTRTIQRRLAVIRAGVFDDLRQAMRLRLNASHDEIESLLGLVQSQLGVTLHRVLARPPS